RDQDRTTALRVKLTQHPAQPGRAFRVERPQLAADEVTVRQAAGLIWGYLQVVFGPAVILLNPPMSAWGHLADLHTIRVIVYLTPDFDLDAPAVLNPETPHDLDVLTPYSVRGALHERRGAARRREDGRGQAELSESRQAQ